MPLTTYVQTDADGIRIHIERVFHTSHEAVYAEWTEPSRLERWFAPDGFIVVGSHLDARPGGKWKIEFRGEDGEIAFEEGEFCEMSDSRRLEFTLREIRNDGNGPITDIVVTLQDLGNQTKMTFLQTGYVSVDDAEENLLTWLACFDKLEFRIDRQSDTMI